MGDVKPPPDTPREGLDWADPDAVKAWAIDVWTQADEAIAAGVDATARPRRRVLSRAEARRKVREAQDALRKAYAYAGLDVTGTLGPALGSVMSRVRAGDVRRRAQRDAAPTTPPGTPANDRGA